MSTRCNVELIGERDLWSRSGEGLVSGLGAMGGDVDHAAQINWGPDLLKLMSTISDRAAMGSTVLLDNLRSGVETLLSCIVNGVSATSSWTMFMAQTLCLSKKACLSSSARMRGFPYEDAGLIVGLCVWSASGGVSLQVESLV